MKDHIFSNDEECLEQNLQAKEEKFRSLVESTKAWILEINVEGVYTYCNPSVQQILGYHPSEMIGQNRLDFIYEDDTQSAYITFQEFITKKQGWNNYQLRCKHRDGSLRHLESDATPIIDNTGNLQGFRVIGRDVTQRKLAEEWKHQHQNDLSIATKQNSMQELVSILSHELAQPLTIINNFVTGCIWRLQSGNFEANKLIDTLQQVVLQVQRSGTIIHHMKDFLRKGKLHLESVDVNQFIKQVLLTFQMLFPQYKTNIQLDLTDEEIILQIDKLQIELVILNLVRNAIEAMEQNTKVNYHEMIVKTKIISDNLFSFQILDSGPGIASGIAENIFKPFFSTKKNGFGVGLSMSRTIIEAHGGDLRNIPRSQGGACFEFTLPIQPILDGL